LGWIEGRNVRLDIYRPTATPDDIRKNVAEVLAGMPDVILTTGSTTTGPLLQATRTVPIVFTSIIDPVGGGFVESLARPGGNATGFMQFEYSLSGKWLELLKQVAPSTTRVAVIRDQTTTAGIGQFAVLQSVAPSVGIEVVPVNVHDADEIERAIGAFSRTPNGGLIAASGLAVNAHRVLILALAARHRLPAVYARRFFVDQGGLMSYGPDVITSSRLAAGYVDRILKGEKPADKPVQAPTKYELVINVRTAKALGLDLPPALLAGADEVIE
jgi:putative ABC transport system substrate-binding protein